MLYFNLRTELGKWQTGRHNFLPSISLTHKTRLHYFTCVGLMTRPGMVNVVVVHIAVVVVVVVTLNITYFYIVFKSYFILFLFYFNCFPVKNDFLKTYLENLGSNPHGPVWAVKFLCGYFLLENSEVPTWLKLELAEKSAFAFFFYTLTKPFVYWYN